MSVNKIARRIPPYQAPKAFKTLVAQVPAVMNVPGRGMRDNDIDSAGAPNLKSHTADFSAHLFFGILVRIAVVPMTTLKTDDAQTAVRDQFAVQIDTAVGTISTGPDIVISFNKIERHI